MACDIIDTSKTTAIPQSTFRIGDLKLLDTIQFMGTSLEELVRNLKTKSEDKFELFHNIEKMFNKEELELICQKGIYQYEYIDGNERFKEEGLPTRKAFYSKLKLSGITRSEYRHAKNV